MKICWAQYLFWLVVAALGAGSVLSACGQKGALYRPAAQPAPTHATSDAPGIAADQPDPKP